MAALTAGAVLLGSGVLAGAAFLADKLKSAPPEEPEALLEAPPAPLPEPEPAAPAPVSDSSEGEDPPTMKGGGIGVPPWGEITQVSPLTPSSVLGAVNSTFVSTDPKALRDEIIKTNQSLEEAQFSLRDIDEKYDAANKKYQAELKEYAKQDALFDQQNDLTEYWKKQARPKQPKLSDKEKADLKEELKTASDERKKQINKRLSGQGGDEKEPDPKDVEKALQNAFEAKEKKITADEARKDAELKKNKLDLERKEILKRKDELEKTVKELTLKRNELLKKLSTQNISKPKTDIPDWQARTTRYTNAVKRRVEAENAFRAFYSETWLPLKGTDKQAVYQEENNRLEAIWKAAVAEERMARAALTASTKIFSTATSDFLGFAQEIEDLTENAVDTSGNILGTYVTPPGGNTGYPVAVKDLKDFVKTKTKVQSAADLYYEMGSLDKSSLVGSRRKFLDVLNKNKFATSKLDVQRFVTVLLGLAENSVRYLPAARNPDRLTDQQKLYFNLREKVNVFVDKQYYYIRKTLRIIREATRLNPGSSESKDMLEIEKLVKELFPLDARVPPQGMCATIFKKETFDYLKSGKYGKEKIEDILLGESTSKQAFLDKIGFIKISNFTEAKEYARSVGNNPNTLMILKSAFLEDIAKKYDRLATNNPDGHNTPVNINVLFGAPFSYDTGIVANPNFEVNPAEVAANPTNAVFARDFRTELTRRTTEVAADNRDHLFKMGEMGVFLDGYTLPLANPPVLTKVPIQTLKDACELDGNVGQGFAQSASIIKLLEKIEELHVEAKEGPNPLLEFIKKLESRGTINPARADQARPITVLGQRGFATLASNWVIMKVSEKNKALNFVQTFLTFRSSKFRSIPYEDVIMYNGKSRNTREVYAELALAEIEKMPSFDARSEADKKAPFKADWGSLSDDFHLNFVLFKEEKRRGVVDYAAAGRDQGPVYHVFKSINDFYYPVYVQAAGQVPILPAPAQGVRRGAPQRLNVGVFDQAGGWIEGPEFYVPEQVSQTEAIRRAARPAIRTANAAGQAIAERGYALGEAAARGVGAAGQAVANRVGPILGVGEEANRRRAAAEAARQVAAAAARDEAARVAARVAAEEAARDEAARVEAAAAERAAAEEAARVAAAAAEEAARAEAARVEAARARQVELDDAFTAAHAASQAAMGNDDNDAGIQTYVDALTAEVTAARAAGKDADGNAAQALLDHQIDLQRERGNAAAAAEAASRAASQQAVDRADSKEELLKIVRRQLESLEAARTPIINSLPDTPLRTAQLKIYDRDIRQAQADIAKLNLMEPNEKDPKFLDTRQKLTIENQRQDANNLETARVIQAPMVEKARRTAEIKSAEKEVHRLTIFKGDSPELEAARRKLDEALRVPPPPAAAPARPSAQKPVSLPAAPQPLPPAPAPVQGQPREYNCPPAPRAAAPPLPPAPRAAPPLPPPPAAAPPLPPPPRDDTDDLIFRPGARVIATHQSPYSKVSLGEKGTIINTAPGGGGGGVVWLVKFDSSDSIQLSAERDLNLLQPGADDFPSAAIKQAAIDAIEREQKKLKGKRTSGGNRLPAWRRSRPVRYTRRKF